MTGSGVKTSEIDGSVYTGSFDHGKVCIDSNLIECVCGICDFSAKDMESLC